MKKIRLIALVICSLAILNSCTDNPIGCADSCTDDDPIWYTENLEVKAKDWQLIGAEDKIGSYYQYIFDGFPYVDGIINVYLYQNFGTKSEKQTPLPYIYYGVDVFEDGSEDHYSIQYSYDIARDGTIALKVYISDYYTRLFRPDDEYFRVTIIY
ncbi:MAG: hypothetical protein LBE04_06905 [Prevotellaceae bacterium]|jgi:hypothetical protein|nr:hypothetical protein [Prevotellaceae bacterium]